jgi:hypothetical protein
MSEFDDYKEKAEEVKSKLIEKERLEQNKTITFKNDGKFFNKFGKRM